MQMQSNELPHGFTDKIDKDRLKEQEEDFL